MRRWSGAVFCGGTHRCFTGEAFPTESLILRHTHGFLLFYPFKFLDPHPGRWVLGISSSPTFLSLLIRFEFQPVRVRPRWVTSSLGAVGVSWIASVDCPPTRPVIACTIGRTVLRTIPGVVAPSESHSDNTWEWVAPYKYFVLSMSYLSLIHI